MTRGPRTRRPAAAVRHSRPFRMADPATISKAARAPVGIRPGLTSWGRDWLPDVGMGPLPCWVRRERARPPRCVIEGPGPSPDRLSSGEDCHFRVSTRLARKLATAVFAIGLHLPLFGPDLNLGALTAKET